MDGDFHKTKWVPDGFERKPIFHWQFQTRMKTGFLSETNISKFRMQLCKWQHNWTIPFVSVWHGVGSISITFAMHSKTRVKNDFLIMRTQTGLICGTKVLRKKTRRDHVRGRTNNINNMAVFRLILCITNFWKWVIQNFMNEIYDLMSWLKKSMRCPAPLLLLPIDDHIHLCAFNNSS